MGKLREEEKLKIPILISLSTSSADEDRIIKEVLINSHACDCLSLTLCCTRRIYMRHNG
jgi:hypothetical protein